MQLKTTRTDGVTWQPVLQLAALFFLQAEYDLALSLLGRSLHIREEQLRLNHPVVLNTLGNMATALYEKVRNTTSR